MTFFSATAFLFATAFGANTELTVKTDAVKIEFTGEKETAGTLSGFQATINFNADDLASSSISGTVDATTLKTDNSQRDEHLKSEDYFDVKKYPTMGFKSTSITKEADKFIMKGLLKIKDTEHEETITFSFADNTFKGTSTIQLSNYPVAGYPKKKPEQTNVKIRFVVPVM